MNNKLPVIGPNVLPPIGEFKVRAVPTLLLDYLAAHGHLDAAPSLTSHGAIDVTYRGFSYLGNLVVYRKTINATMEAVREFLGYPA